MWLAADLLQQVELLATVGAGSSPATYGSDSDLAKAGADTSTQRLADPQQQVELLATAGADRSTLKLDAKLPLSPTSNTQLDAVAQQQPGTAQAPSQQQAPQRSVSQSEQPPDPLPTIPSPAINAFCCW